MQTLYNLATGPLAWAAWAIFIIGSVWRVASTISLARKKEMSSVAYMSWSFSLRSIFRWLTPYATLGWRLNPGLTAATFLFHISLALLLIFAPGHTVMWDYNFGLSLWSLPEGLSDAMTIAAIGCLAFFVGRRLLNVCIRYVTTPHDWAVLALVALPFVSAFMAKMQVGDPLLMTLIHVLSGEAVLVAIPFTRLSHALLSPLTRAYMGSEFGGVRHCPDW
ncbi:respiratory nitrate reductase subunit gamma [Desulfovibrio sp. OttesenSCG-928-M14]|nr:respiratory nitrate reductase subunit gamma [Desulfovibrio sp. OttesenSCG-928-M14]MDL2290478.1 respiratory nitrate reductase subunit gamma [Desulfovibrio sp. OttesenSCG-928-F20]